MNLIVGGDSLIGGQLASYWKQRQVSLRATTRKQSEASAERPYLDLETMEWSSVLEEQYDTVVFCAGVTKLSECESNPQRSYRINVENAVILLTELLKRAGYLLILSSSQVFDGLKPCRAVDEVTCPITEYGRQKVALEEAILAYPNTGVLRLTKVVHQDWNLLVNWREKLLRGEPIEALSNVTFAPLDVAQVVRKIDELVGECSASIHHLSGPKDISYVFFAKQLALDLGASPSLVREVRVDPKERTVYASLS